MRKIYSKDGKLDACCFCGLKKCYEASDHTFMSISELKNIIHGAKVYNPIADRLKAKAS